MRATDDDLNPLGDGERFSYVGAARMLSKALPILVPALVAAVTSIVAAIPAIRGTLADANKASAQVRTGAQKASQEVKDKAEAGFQSHDHRLDALEARFLAWEQTHTPPVRKGAKRRQLQPQRPVRNPETLDEALVQVRRGVLPAPATHPDGGP